MVFVVLEVLFIFRFTAVEVEFDVECDVEFEVELLVSSAHSKNVQSPFPHLKNFLPLLAPSFRTVSSMEGLLHEQFGTLEPIRF